MHKWQIELRWQLVGLMSTLWFVLFILRPDALDLHDPWFTSKCIFCVGIVLTMCQYKNKGKVVIDRYDVLIAIFSISAIAIANLVVSRPISLDKSLFLGVKWGWPLAWYKVYPDHSSRIEMIAVIKDLTFGTAIAAVGAMIRRLPSR